jgi:molecular chaperone HscA
MAKIGINLTTGSLQQAEMIVGIDLGTTHSLISIIHPETKKPIILKEFDESALVPSIIHFDVHDMPVVGEEARKKLVEAPERTIFSVKRLLGKTYRELTADSRLSYRIHDDQTDNLVKVQLGNRFYSPVELSAQILMALRSRAEHILKTPVSKAVITVPAYFNDAQRQATRDAGKLAGLDVLRIINEPTAASLAYGIGAEKNQSNKKIAVYDLGGGTFDVSILALSDGVFDVLSTNGDTYLGGDDIDHLIVDHWKNEWKKRGVLISPTDSQEQQLRLKAETAKKNLSQAELFQDTCLDISIVLERKTLEELMRPLIERTITCCRNAMRDAGLKVGEIDEVVMVGGSTRIPIIKQSVADFFGREVHDDLNPDEVVALGAAIQADVLAGNNREILLLDITPLSLGIETAGGLMDVLISRNAKIPSRAARQYTTQVDGQSSMRISVYQGERDLVQDNRKLAEFNLKGIPGMPAGLPKVEIGFLINADGILTVTARELRSGIEQSIEVRPQQGLSDQEVEQMLMDSITHAKEDIKNRALAEARTEAEQLLKTTERFLQKHMGELRTEELTTTAHAMQALQMAITMEDKDLIHQKQEALNDISRPYAERIMDLAVAAALKGNRID